MSVTVPFDAPARRAGAVPAASSPPAPALRGHDPWPAAGRGLPGQAGTWTKAVYLPADPSAASEARAHVRRVLESWKLDPAGDTVAQALLLTSELVTNALTHGRSAATVAVSLAGATVRVEVHDGAQSLAARPMAGSAADAEAGRGLLLVDALAADWGFYRTPGGKAVYFTLRAHPGP